MHRFAALLAVLGFATISVQARLGPETGALLLHTYTPNEYGANPQTWSVVQDARGVMFFGNNSGVLEFDGVSWRKIEVAGQFVRSLAIDTRGTIFVGGRGNFGYLAPSPGGDLRFISLSEKVSVADRDFNDVWDVLPTADGVFFASYKRVFLYTPASVLKVFRPAKTGGFGRAFTYHSEFYITSAASGLLTMQNGDLVDSRIRGDQGLLHGAHGVALFAAGALPLIAYDRKLFRFSLGSIDPFPTAGDSYFKEHEITSVSQLPGGDIAVGTASGGLVMLNQKGEVERLVRRTDGLPSNSISASYSDRQGNIWATTDNGLARFPIDLTQFGETQGIHGLAYAVARIQGVLYVGTSLGLFQMHPTPQAVPAFTPVLEVQERVFSVVERSGVAFVATEHGLFTITGKKFERILPNAFHHVYDIASSRSDSNTFYTAGGDGVQVLRRSGNTWKILNKESTGQDFFSVAEAKDGRVWATSEGSAWRIDFSSATPKSEQFKQEHGIPAGYVYVLLFRDHPVFATQRGLLLFSEPDKRMLPDPELGPRFSSGELIVSAVQEDPQKDVWITGSGYHGILHGPRQEWFGNPLLEAQPGELFWIYIDPDGTCWTAGNTGGLARYEYSRSRKPEFGVLLRNAILTNDERTIYKGDADAKPLRLAHKDNALRFEFAEPFYPNEAAVQYQYRLLGNGSAWSAWTQETRKDYTNLFEGNYNFEVRAQNPHGVTSAAASYKFSLEAPWYRRWWAFAIYVACFLFAGWLILRWRLRALEAKNRWLEGVVEERTAEVRTERDQNEALLLNILPKPIASELRTTGSVKPASFDDVTVCFSDFVGFTLSSEKLPPQELISSLNEYFTAFDEIIGRYGLEKLKTIGDAYMFAGGLPNASPSHAVDSVLAALEMVEVVRQLAKPDKGVNWKIRLGLYSGPVVAGVVGVRKFAFDIWGNTVNFAARMESAGSANRVNLSETTGRRVFDFIECEPRGLVRIKEGREMDMYFAVGPKSELLAGPLVEGIPETFRLRYERAFAKPPKSFPNQNGFHAG